MIKLQDVELRFGDRTILNKVNLEIADNETIAILGGSGAGKSTILRLIIGLLKPTGGKILVNGQDITKMNTDELNKVRQDMGMVFQYSALFDSMTVGENVAFGLRQHTDYSDEKIRQIVLEKLEMVGMKNTMDLMPREISGGMKKRVGLARAIALNPDIILYDEPTSGLDPITSRTISQLICYTSEKLNCTSVVVTHDMQSAFTVADRIALLGDGKFIEVSPTEEFKNSKNPKVQQFINGISEQDLALLKKENQNKENLKEDDE